MLLVLTAIALAQSPAASWAGDGAGQLMKDSWVTTKAKMALVKDGRVKARHIKIETQEGVVTLRGKVASAEERAAAEELARGIEGATSVSNALQVVADEQRKLVDAKDEELEKAVKGRFEKDAQLKDAEIKVRADNSVVTLIGKVPDTKAKARASDLTRGVPGVRAVRNELAQKG
jgi:osmotically-inducible protein OsmY